MRFILRTLFEKNSIDVSNFFLFTISFNSKFQKSIFQTVNEAEEWLLDGLIAPLETPSSDEIVNIVDKMADEIARHLEGSIADLPKHRKAAGIMLANDLIHEDLKGNKKICNHFSKSGVPRILCEELLHIDFDWNIVTAARKEGGGGVAGVNQAEHISNYNLFISILVSFFLFVLIENLLLNPPFLDIPDALRNFRIWMARSCRACCFGDPCRDASVH